MTQLDSNTLTVELHDAPLQPDQEWANALTHGIGAVVALLVGGYMVAVAFQKDAGLGIACGVYIVSAFGTFLFSTLSHLFTRQPMLNRLRAWDQAMIYTMIAGTYTPIVYLYASGAVLAPLLVSMWLAAAIGFVGKVALQHRVNSIGTISYLLLGWLPAIPLAANVPSGLGWVMLAGGVMYSLGVVCLLNDRRMRYMHAVWHLCVMLAASCHYIGILRYVVEVA